MPQLTAILPASLTDRARSFLTWWTGELDALVPDGLRRLGKPVPRADIHLSRTGIIVDRERDGIGERLSEPRGIDQLDDDGWAEFAGLIDGTRARLMLSPPDVFITRLTLPVAARSRLRSAVALQLRQVAPLEPEHLVWNCRVLDDRGKDIVVLVAMARAEWTARIAALFEANGMPAPPVVARTEEHELQLLAGADGSLTPERRRIRKALAMAALLLATVPLTTWAAASLFTWTEERHTQSLHVELAPRLAEDRARARDERARQALKHVFGLPSATSVVEGLALGLPDNAFAVTAERQYDGRFTFSAQTTDREALEGAMAESRVLAEVHVADMVPVDGGSLQLSFAGNPR